MSEMFKIALPDGSSREMPQGSTPADVAAAIGPGLAKAALAARVDGELRDLNRPFEGDSSVALVRGILAGARVARPRYTQMASFVRDLQNQIDAL